MPEFLQEKCTLHLFACFFRKGGTASIREEKVWEL